MFRLYAIPIILGLISCGQTGKRVGDNRPVKAIQKPQPKWIDILEPDHDTLPNGIRLLDNRDSGMRMYYKEVVGSDTLKGGYIFCYGIDDSTKYLYIIHGDRLRLLGMTPIYTSTWSLGTLEKDFDTYFMTQIDNGNGCPATYELFEKRTGRNILGDDIEANSYKFLRDTLFMLYDNRSKDKKTDSITLFNVKLLKRESFKLPKDLPEFYDIQIEKLTDKYLKIGYCAFVGYKGDKFVTYSR